MNDNEQQVLIFNLNQQEYALTLQETQEIIRMTDITRVPNTVQHVEGIINLRGSILPVVSLSKCLGLSVKEYDDDTRIIVVENEGRKVGIIVDNVVEVGSYTQDEVEPPNVSGENAEYLNAVLNKGDRLWLLLNLSKAL